MCNTNTSTRRKRIRLSLPSCLETVVVGKIAQLSNTHWTFHRRRYPSPVVTWPRPWRDGPRWGNARLAEGKTKQDPPAVSRFSLGYRNAKTHQHGGTLFQGQSDLASTSPRPYRMDPWSSDDMRCYDYGGLGIKGAVPLLSVDTNFQVAPTTSSKNLATIFDIQEQLFQKVSTRWVCPRVWP